MGLFDRFRRKPDAILPVLKAPDWGGARMLRRRLTDIGHPDIVPWVAFGIDHPTLIEFVGEQAESVRGRSLADIEAEAIANLGRFPCRWKEDVAEAADGARGVVLMAMGPYAAERVLDARFMREAQQRLGSEIVAVGMPHRNMLVAAGRPEGMLFAGFQNAVQHAHTRGSGAAISPGVFLMRGTTVIASPADPPARRTKDRGAEHARDAASVTGLKIITRSPESGLEEVVLAVGPGARSFGEAVAALQDMAVRALNEQQWNPAFGGVIRAFVDPDEVPGASDHAADLAKLSADMERSLRAVRATAIGGQPISLVVRVGRPK
jgi:hypothetical protein